MKMLKLAVVVLVGSLGFVQKAKSLTFEVPIPSAYEQAFGECKKGPCMIIFNGGGDVDLFTEAAKEIVAAKRQIVIAGVCGSSCALFADYARPYVCILQNARFYYHLGTTYQLVGIKLPFLAKFGFYVPTARSVLPHSLEIKNWVNKNGGWPAEGFLLMNAEEASEFWQVCGGPPTPRLRPPRD